MCSSPVSDENPTASAQSSPHLCHAGKGKSLHKLNLNWQCVIGSTLAFKNNCLNISKVENDCTQVFLGLISM